MDIRQVLENKIKEANLSKREVANRMGIASQNLNSMMTTPTWATLERIASALDMSVSELVRDPNDGSQVIVASTSPVIKCPDCGREIVLKVE